eukprot:2092787-Pleurochrysis_carterae.AAC.1
MIPQRAGSTQQHGEQLLYALESKVLRHHPPHRSTLLMPERDQDEAHIAIRRWAKSPVLVSAASVRSKLLKVPPLQSSSRSLVKLQETKPWHDCAIHRHSTLASPGKTLWQALHTVSQPAMLGQCQTVKGRSVLCKPPSTTPTMKCGTPAKQHDKATASILASAGGDMEGIAMQDAFGFFQCNSSVDSGQARPATIYGG